VRYCWFCWPLTKRQNRWWNFWNCNIRTHWMQQGPVVLWIENHYYFITMRVLKPWKWGYETKNVSLSRFSAIAQQLPSPLQQMKVTRRKGWASHTVESLILRKIVADRSDCRSTELSTKSKSFVHIYNTYNDIYTCF